MLIANWEQTEVESLSVFKYDHVKMPANGNFRCTGMSSLAKILLQNGLNIIK